VGQVAKSADLRLVLDEPRSGALGLALSHDEVDEEGGNLVVAAVAAIEIVTTLSLLRVLRSSTSRMRRPLPVTVTMPWDLLGSWWAGGCRSTLVPAVRAGRRNGARKLPLPPVVGLSRKLARRMSLLRSGAGDAVANEALRLLGYWTS
jgi:hypothetical protein